MAEGKSALSSIALVFTHLLYGVPGFEWVMVREIEVIPTRNKPGKGKLMCKQTRPLHHGNAERGSAGQGPGIDPLATPLATNGPPHFLCANPPTARQVPTTTTTYNTTVTLPAKKKGTLSHRILHLGKIQGNF